MPVYEYSVPALAMPPLPYLRIAGLLSVVGLLIGVIPSGVKTQAVPLRHANPFLDPFLPAAASSITGYTPAQIRKAYGIDRLTQTGAGQTVAVIGAYDAPAIASDLAVFSAQFGLAAMNGSAGSSACTVAAGPAPCFEKVFAQGKTSPDPTWAKEISLDVEWLHAIAPQANILLIEAKDSSVDNLLGAADLAVSRGIPVISMSWGTPEGTEELSYDKHFQHPGTVFLAASGDHGYGTDYPSSSPYVVAVGGTSLILDKDGNPTSSESAWTGSGGGTSAYEKRPAFQNGAFTASEKRGVPDVSYNADPRNGFAVYDSTGIGGRSGWLVVGGTSAGTPQWAGLIALANQGRKTPLSTGNLARHFLYLLHSQAPLVFQDITQGRNGVCGDPCQASAGYDLVTGLGTPQAQALVPALTSLGL